MNELLITVERIICAIIDEHKRWFCVSIVRWIVYLFYLCYNVPIQLCGLWLWSLPADEYYEHQNLLFRSTNKPFEFKPQKWELKSNEHKWVLGKERVGSIVRWRVIREPKEPILTLPAFRFSFTYLLDPAFWASMVDVSR